MVRVSTVNPLVTTSMMPLTRRNPLMDHVHFSGWLRGSLLMGLFSAVFQGTLWLWGQSMPPVPSPAPILSAETISRAGEGAFWVGIGSLLAMVLGFLRPLVEKRLDQSSVARLAKIEVDKALEVMRIQNERIAGELAEETAQKNADSDVRKLKLENEHLHQIAVMKERIHELEMRQGVSATAIDQNSSAVQKVADHVGVTVETPPRLNGGAGVLDQSSERNSRS